jgi:hypothetical protein
LRNSVEDGACKSLRFGAERVRDNKIGDRENHWENSISNLKPPRKLLLLPSADRGARRTAQKAQYHHDHFGSIMASNKGDPALKTVVTKTSQFARRRCTRSPVARLRTIPIMTLGMKRIAASNADKFWTSWKLFDRLVLFNFMAIEILQKTQYCFHAIQDSPGE